MYFKNKVIYIYIYIYIVLLSGSNIFYSKVNKLKYKIRDLPNKISN